MCVWYGSRLYLANLWFCWQIYQQLDVKECENKFISFEEGASEANDKKRPNIARGTTDPRYRIWNVRCASLLLSVIRFSYFISLLCCHFFTNCFNISWYDIDYRLPKICPFFWYSDTLCDTRIHFGMLGCTLGWCHHENFLNNFFINLLSATLLPAVCTGLVQNWALQIFGNTGKRILLESAEFILFAVQQ